MSDEHWILGINPEPWAIGTAFRSGKGANIAPNPKMNAYKQALRDEIVAQNVLPEPLSGRVRVVFGFWRSTAHGNVADATNLQKSTEDALQGILYGNDRGNVDVRGVIVEQGPEVEPAILIRIETFGPGEGIFDHLAPPEPEQVRKFSDSTWSKPDEELF